jgi:hypothetical protein
MGGITRPEGGQRSETVMNIVSSSGQLCEGRRQNSSIIGAMSFKGQLRSEIHNGKRWAGRGQAIAH